MMAQNTAPDQDFVSALRSLPTGIYYRDVARYSSEKVAAEFRNAVALPEMVADEDFMANVLFLIRKREIRPLRDDVGRLLSSGKLKPRASVSALKTMVAIGNQGDQVAVDRIFSELLKTALKTPQIEHQVVPWAERVGGPETLATMGTALDAATIAQRSAESAHPRDIAKISQLDRLRSSLANQQAVLTRKLEIGRMAESERAFALTELYLRRVGHLAVWAYKELVDDPSAASAAGVRAFLAGPVESMVPKSATGEAKAELLQGLRLRGLCLLMKMEQASPQERSLVEQNNARIAANPVFYQPKIDWEDVLDKL